METKTKVMMACAIALGLGLMAEARTIEIKQLKSTGSKTNAEYWWQGTEKSKSSWFQIKIGGASQIDDTSEMEIRAATVFKSAKDKKTGINDVATFKFDPINKGKAIFFMVSTGAAFSRERDSSYWYADFKTGWQLAGCIIEIWQKGKVVRHWSNMSGKDGKTKLTDDIRKLRINRDGHPSAGERYYSPRDFDNATEIYSVDQKGERVDIDEVLKPFRESENVSKSISKGNDTSATQPPVKNTVAPKLRTCEFLLNKKFKKNAKFYLCLFSASWCPPCRREMPRIAKTYAETLKDDPDIELIHFSRDQNDEKAMAWAKEHDVKFPVVKPKGGNPLDLHTRGIPHLFIVKADGTLLEEGHPMRIFNEEKFRELKGGNYVTSAKAQNEKPDMKAATGEQTETIDGYTWTFRVSNGEATIMSEKKTGRRYSCAVSPKPTGNVTIPSTLGGAKVTSIGQNAFRCCSGLTSVTIPSSVTSIGDRAFSGCKGLTSVTIPDGVTNIGKSAFYACRGLKSVSIPSSVRKIEPLAFYNSGLTSVTIPEGVVSIGDSAFGDCWSMTSVTVSSSVTSIGSRAFSSSSGRMTSIVVSPENSKYASMNGLLCTKDGKTVIAGVDGDVTVPEGVTGIDDGAFYKCSGLTTVTIPASVVSIGKSAFEWCSRVNAFSVSPKNPKYASANGLLCAESGKTLIAGINGEIVIPEGVTEIVDLAFSSRDRLISVTIPASVSRIGHEVFRRCRGLTSVTMYGELPNSGRNVFSYCDKLKSIHVPPNAKSWAGMKEWQGIPLVFDAESK